MSDEATNTGYTYASYLLGKWLEVKALSEEFNRDYIQASSEEDQDERIVSNQEKNSFYEYISKMVNLYGELLPKLETRTDLGKEFRAEFKKFEKYHTNSKLLLEDGNENDISAMERIIGVGLEKLKILKFESAL